MMAILYLGAGYEGMFFHIRAEIKIPEMFERCFDSVDLCDDVFISAIVGGVSNEQMKTIMKTRQDAADVLSKELAKLIVNEMKRHDTHNGEKANHDNQIHRN